MVYIDTDSIIIETIVKRWFCNRKFPNPLFIPQRSYGKTITKREIALERAKLFNDNVINPESISTIIGKIKLNGGFIFE